MRILRLLRQLFCLHRRSMLVKYRGPIRLRERSQYWECQACGKHFPTVYSHFEPTKDLTNRA